ncbi:MAG: LuxR C-terminal-related transcriptional regulator [Bacteroidota bacterium]
MIKVLVIDEHQLMCDGIKNILHQTDDIHMIDCVSHAETIAGKLKALDSHILLFNIYQLDEDQLTLICKICKDHPKIKVLINAMFSSEYFILRTIKAGAKGYLSKDDGADELKQAIYTLRNGYDFHGKSISNILLSNYLKQHRGDEKGLEELTQREKEVLHLFGESKTNKEIAETLFISVRTVESHKNNIMKKINLKTTVDLVKFAIKNNIIQL